MNKRGRLLFRVGRADECCVLCVYSLVIQGESSCLCGEVGT